jgi:hypothetical protein
VERTQSQVSRKSATPTRSNVARAVVNRQHEKVMRVVQSKNDHQPSFMRQCDKCAEEVQAKSNTNANTNTAMPNVSQPNDPLEVQADQVANSVMAKTEPGFNTSLARGPVGSLQRVCTSCEAKKDKVYAKAASPEVETEEEIQRKCNSCEEEVQRRAQSNVVATPRENVWPRINNVFRTGRPLPEHLLGFYEERMGYDFSPVRIHTQQQANDVASEINARAFTYGHHVVFGSGEYQPDSYAGRHLLAHELTHVVQQGAVKPAQHIEEPAPQFANNEPNNSATANLATAPNLATANNLTTVQRQDSGYDPFAEMEREINGVISEAEDAFDEATDAVVGTVTDAADTVADVASDVYNGAADLASDAYDALGDLADDALDTLGDVLDDAIDLARALSGIVSLRGTRLVITLPSMNVCPTTILDIALPGIDIDLPLLSGSLQIDNVTLTGSVGIVYSIAPNVRIQLGPCLLHGVRLEKDLLGFGWSVAGNLGVTSVFGIAFDTLLAASATVDMLAVLPTAPPNEIAIPGVGLELGVVQEVRAVAADTTELALSASGGFASVSADVDLDKYIDLALDFGLAGMGHIDIQGVNLCTFYQPFYEQHLQTALHLGIHGGISVSLSGASASLGITDLSVVPFGGLPPAFSRDLFTDDCARLERWCQILYNMGWMPSQNGGAWTGHPTPPWAAPLHVYPRDPSQLDPTFTAGSLCRGTCGPDCMTCSSPYDRVQCVPKINGDGTAGHEIWVYPNYQKGPTHEGCRQHDAGYDYCASGASPLGNGLCSRLCDLECMCNYPPFNCLSWVFGGPPNDDRPMVYSDRPYKASECALPCPSSATAPPAPIGVGEGADHATMAPAAPGAAAPSGTSTTAWGGGSVNNYSICLPTLELFGRQPWQSDIWTEATPDYTIWHQWIPLPPPLFLGHLTLTMNGSATASAGAGIGPATIENVCFGVDLSPGGGGYFATGMLNIAADFNARLTLAGNLCADAGLLGVIDLIGGCIGVEATGALSLRGNLAAVMQLQQAGEMTCDGGRPKLNTDLGFNLDALLDFGMDATFSIRSGILGQLYSTRWNLIQAQWAERWGHDLELNSNPIGDPSIDLRNHRFTLSEIGDLLIWLFSDDAETEEVDTNNQKTVKEDPLTALTARSIPSLASQLDRPQHSGSNLALVNGASSGVGTNMISSFITHNTLMGSETSPGVQPELYGYGKLPTKGDLGSGTGQGKSIQYIKGHLLNFHHSRGLGGFAINNNLYPITAMANSRHNTGVEENVKDLVHDDLLVVMYQVTVRNVDGPHLFNARDDDPTKTCMYQYINADFVCRYATYKLYSDNTVALNTPTEVTVDEDFDVNAFKARMIAKDCPNKP